MVALWTKLKLRPGISEISSRHFEELGAQGQDFNLLVFGQLNDLVDLVWWPFQEFDSSGAKRSARTKHGGQTASGT